MVLKNKAKVIRHAKRVKVIAKQHAHDYDLIHNDSRA
jgi:hypothetical protein